MKMNKINKAVRLYFYPIITANMIAMTLVVGGDIVRALLFSIVISFLASFGFLINDLWDIEIDKINKAGHFENSDSGVIKTAIVSCAAFLVAGLILAYFIGKLEFMIAGTIAFGLMAYTVLLRRILFAPNIVAAILSSSPLWIPLVFWSKTFDKPKIMFVGAIVAFILAREIIMDTRDTVGDIAGGRDTFATLFSPKIGKFIGVVLTVSAGIPFILAVTASIYTIPIKSQIFGISIAGILLYLLIPSAVGTLLSVKQERKAINFYVRRSRIAMALIPLLVIFLWSA